MRSGGKGSWTGFGKLVQRHGFKEREREVSDEKVALEIREHVMSTK